MYNPYAGRMIQAAVPSFAAMNRYSQRVQLASKYGPKSYKAVKLIAKKWRTYRKKRKPQAARRTNPSIPRRSRVEGRITVDEQLSPFNLDVRVIAMPVKSDVIGTREALQMKLHGIKLCETYYNTRENNLGATVELHWALCQLKAPLEEFDESNASNQEAIIKEYISGAFFRDNTKDLTTTGSLGRSAPFVDAPLLYPFDYLCRPLNKDRFNIITHKRFDLPPRSPESLAMKTWFRKVERYFKINKMVAFRNERDRFGKCPIFVCTWHVTKSPEDYPTTPATAAPYVRRSFQENVYFSSPN